jgi:lipopolysaccharide transport system permease protein
VQTATSRHAVSPRALLASAWRYRALIVQMARRDVVGRYRGSFVGLLWSFFNPLLMLAIYTFVFGVIFNSHWSKKDVGHFGFAVILFAGLNINSLFAECANRASTLVIENANFVKKVVFPLDTLAWSTVGSALFHLFVSTIVLLLFLLIVQGSVPWTVVLFPVVTAAFLPFVLGTIWLISALGVFLRDLKQVMGIVTAALMFLAPIFYPLALIPPGYRRWVYLNPLTVIVEASRDVLVWGTLPDWWQLGVYAALGCLFAWAAFAWFELARRGFADVL